MMNYNLLTWIKSLVKKRQSTLEIKSESHHCTLNFSRYRYFEKYQLVRCDRQTHRAEEWSDKVHQWQEIHFCLDAMKPIAADDMDWLERSCRNLGFEPDTDGSDWDTWSELIPSGERGTRYTNYPFERNLSLVVIAAAHLAERLHKEQVDKAGKPYFRSHLLPVGAMGTTWQQKVVGLLHDAAEDTPYTAHQVIEMLGAEIDVILAMHRDPWIIEMEQTLQAPIGATCDRPSTADWSELEEALLALNHHLYPSREEYIAHIKTNPLATQVKLNDLTSNMDLSRISHPTEKDKERTARYQREYQSLLTL